MSATALRHGLWTCHVCELLNHVKPVAKRGTDPEWGLSPSSPPVSCARCGATLHARIPNSYQRAWAFLIAAAILYIPANMLPVLHTGSIFGRQTDTIMSGVVHLWVTGSWGLAVIVFIASIVVPAAKILSLGFLLTLAKRRSTWRPDQRARLYRATHSIGRWSMVDIYVGATLVALVHLGPFANIEPGPAAIPFGAVVILTMLASFSFDPRLTWDAVDERHD